MPSASGPRSATFASFRFPNYRLWFAAALVANVGMWAQRIGMDWIVLTDLSDESGTAVGLSVALQFLPTLLLSPYAGLLADRLPRRRLLMTTQGAQAVVTFTAAALVLSGAVRLWHVFALALVGGTVAAIDGPVKITFVNEFVPQDSVTNAVGLNSASFNVARLIGPAVAGLLIAAFGPGWVFVIAGLTFGCSISALASMNAATMHSLPPVPRARGQVLEAVRYVRRRRDLVATLTVLGVVTMFGLAFQLTSAMMARIEFGRGAGEFGALGSALAVGSLTGALLAARRKYPRVRLVLGSGFALSVALGVSALMPSFGWYLVAAAPIGFASMTMITAANATIQTRVEPSMRGRVMALYLMIFLGGVPVGSPLLGWIGETLGPRAAIGLGAVATFAVCAVMSVVAVRRWGVRPRYYRCPTTNRRRLDLDLAKAA